MRHFLLAFSLLFLTGLTENRFSQTVETSRQNQNCNYDFSAVTTLAQNVVNTASLPGASLLLVKDGKVIYERHFGSYNANTTVFIASASKWLAGATLMTLVDEGKLSLDDPVSKYLPYFTGDKSTMTLRQMFSHTSGLPPDVAMSGTPTCLDNRNTTMDACAREISQLSLIGAPGSRFAYGGNSMQVAARVCEVVSEKSWEQLFQERIASPLGMANTTFSQSSNPLVAGGARSRLGDYANFLQMILNDGSFNGRRVLSQSSVREMQKDQTFNATIVFSPHTQYGNGEFRYGIGQWLDIKDAQGNSIQVSSQGGFGFSPWLDKKRKLFGIFMVQTQLPNVYATVTQIQQKVREAIDACAGSVTGVSAASYSGNALAAESIVSAFGTNLATNTASAATTPLPAEIAGTIVRVQDSVGAERSASLFFVSPTQINFQIPQGTANGAAKITVTSGNGTLSIGNAQIASVSPGIFTADASGNGLAAATVLRIKADGSQVYEPVARFDSTTNRLVAVPIDLSNAGEQAYLLLFGSGLRFRSSLSNTGVKIGGIDVTALYAGSQGDFVGLDQVNILLPRELTGRGEINVLVTVDGQTSNTVKVQIK